MFLAVEARNASSSRGELLHTFSHVFTLEAQRHLMHESHDVPGRTCFVWKEGLFESTFSPFFFSHTTASIQVGREVEPHGFLEPSYHHVTLACSG